MKKRVSVLLLSLPMMATAINCNKISTNIAEKIKNNSVYASQELIEGKIVESCDHGQQHTVYVRLKDISVATESIEQVPTTTNIQEEDTKVNISVQQETQPTSSIEIQEPKLSQKQSKQHQ